MLKIDDRQKGSQKARKPRKARKATNEVTSKMLIPAREIEKPFR